VRVEIAARHVEVTEPVESYIQQHVARLPAFAEKAQHLTVTVHKDSGNLRVELLAKSGRAELVAEASTHDLYKSIDEAFAKLERQIARQHDKLVKGKARKGHRTAEADRKP